MNNLKILFVLLVASTASFAQEKELKGSITNATDVAGIHIRNQSSRHNSVTHNDGTFKIKAKVNDTLLVSSIVYVPQQIIVSEKAYNEATLVITLTEVINELDEVKVGDQLSKEERQQMNKVEEGLKNDMSWEKMEFEYEFTQDKFSSIMGNKAHDAFFNGQQQNDGVKLQMIIPAVVNFLKRKKTEELPKLPKDIVRYFLKDKFTKNDLQSYFNIPIDSAEDFLYFLVEEGVPDDFLDEENEMNLTQLISEKAKLYNASAKE
ncbi:hypothetical protein SCB49_03955 [unidentified eubacterium SCB49]|nr:hypothetical protein SCB49_03955 [unidentified eubacterium SCB49]